MICIDLIRYSSAKEWEVHIRPFFYLGFVKMNNCKNMLWRKREQGKAGKKPSHFAYGKAWDNKPKNKKQTRKSTLTSKETATTTTTTKIKKIKQKRTNCYVIVFDEYPAGLYCFIASCHYKRNTGWLVSEESAFYLNVSDIISNRTSLILEYMHNSFDS